ncbi:MAG: GYD domain-containing protein [Acidobacteria bacterium]|nr:GYD domain-containing protein [Acidobacteriota bacterium]MCW5970064.1 GYD domain-containing protein [Blastocatellales bacterium]
MATFVMLVKMSPELARDFKSMEAIGKQVGAKYKAACPDVQVSHHLALLGPYDFMDVLEAPDQEVAYKMASVIRSSGMASEVVVWPAITFTYEKMLELTSGY